MQDSRIDTADTADTADIDASARLLEQGELVAFPTETVYGLGADAENPAAVARIYEAKGRPANHPVIVHLAPEADIRHWAGAVPEAAQKLIQTYWPGPLTLILKRAPHIPDAVSGGQDSIGLRCPSHPVAQALLRAFKGGRGGVAAPSANKFGHVSPTTAQHVRDEFGEGEGSSLAAILDGGPSEVGIESTIVDLSRFDTHGAVLLRPGRISVEEIERVIGQPLGQPDKQAPRASGTLEAHYAPGTPVALIAPEQIAATLRKLEAAGHRAALILHSAELASLVADHVLLPADAAGYAHGLYAALRDMDQHQAAIILVEATPGGGEWQGVNDRLRRAAHDSQGVLDRLLPPHS
ncbi:L-threonylcarbamoyladenylate synthase [Noviherbaspirillum humi]|uniref:Threonylcarbamoyl-AMP synthase n=1 Tax=Noviherbaspirillum humi TaxID=1688639 RepID=A0A239E2W9_9BURK|nr:L-threonylcarbamoyladenylate synthase [Noviherbaspirillum humi]SNS38312.1 L-threonylcarbamoyladenylate synthase [Noviherbaspirillum humi]